MKKLVIFLDCGDTLADESTEIKNEDDNVASSELIPGAKEALCELVKRGFRLCLVADGTSESFRNIMFQHGIYDCFEAMIYSEAIKATKPNAKMFKAAMGAMELEKEDVSSIIMVGNNLERDIKGANQVGIPTVHMTWTNRYPKKPADESEVPTYQIANPMELIDLAEKIEKEIDKN